MDVHSIGAGGGSIAWIDPGGALMVGPQSAGAEPGPAAYNQGGTKPTSDASSLGYINRISLRRRRAVDISLSEKAIKQHIADPLD